MTNSLVQAVRSESGSVLWHSLAAALLIVGGVGGLVYWAGTTEIAGAIVAGGTLVVESHAKLVQHQDGGTIKAILVGDDEPVHAGQVLLTLEDIKIRARLDASTAQLSDALVEQARLEAEIEGKTEFAVPMTLAGANAADIVATQRQVLISDLADRDVQIAEFKEQVAQLEHQADGLAMQQQSIGHQLEILRGRAATVDALMAKQLAQADEASTLHLQLAATEGEQGRLTAAIAETRATIAEKLLAERQVQTAFLSARLEALRKARLTAAQALQDQRSAQDELDRTIVRAPESGIVHELVAHTIGGVVAPGETIMKIVPQTDSLLVAIRVDPNDIDQVRLGQPVTLRFTGFERRRLPEAVGSVEQVSPDLVTDQQGARSYYTVNVRIAPRSNADWPADFHLLPGMPVEAFLTTGDRTVMSYLIHPFVEELQLAFREP